MPLPSNGERAPARFWQNSAQSNFSPMAAIMNAAPCTTFILIHHLLDVYNCLQHSTASAPRWLNDTLNAGLNYCQIIVKPDGHFPLLKDSAQGIAPSLSTIMSYAEELGLKPTHVSPKAFFISSNLATLLLNPLRIIFYSIRANFPQPSTRSRAL